jgi:hypothetical protein
VGLALSPWIVRNYRLTGTILPTSTHGGVQLWYGSLQVGPYLESRAYNPRSIFEASSFDYTSMAGERIIVTAEQQPCDGTNNGVVDLVFWTDRDPRQTTVSATPDDRNRLTFELPGQPLGTVLYYFFRMRWKDDVTSELRVQDTPFEGASAPLVFFVSADHLNDLDRHGDLLDAFDIIRLMRYLAWREAAGTPPMDVDGDSEPTERDLVATVVRLLGDRATEAAIRQFTYDESNATLHLSDGSTLTVARATSARITDLDVRGALAGSLISARRRVRADADAVPPRIESCRRVWDIAVNDVFYRKEPHQMRRYMALAMDNISRDPIAFLAASAYRMGRLFVIRGSDDRQTTQQFEGSRPVYIVALLLSLLYVTLFVLGVMVAWRRYPGLRLLLVPIVYVPLTICFVLTNMRYTVTVQPLMFVFVAVALLTLLRISSEPSSPRSLPARDVILPS